MVPNTELMQTITLGTSDRRLHRKLEMGRRLCRSLQRSTWHYRVLHHTGDLRSRFASETSQALVSSYGQSLSSTDGRQERACCLNIVQALHQDALDFIIQRADRAPPVHL